MKKKPNFNGNFGIIKENEKGCKFKSKNKVKKE